MKKKKDNEQSNTADREILQNYIDHDLLRWNDEGPVPFKRDKDTKPDKLT